MGHLSYTSEEIGQRGEKFYNEKLRALIETPTNLGKRLSVDIVTGDYEIDDDAVAAALRLLKRNPEATLYGIRIGQDCVYSFGSLLSETSLLPSPPASFLGHPPLPLMARTSPGRGAE